MPINTIDNRYIFTYTHIMTYNIHPILVHFPIAFLLLYSAVKILPLEKLFPIIAWKHIERVLLLSGLLGAIGSILTGDVARHMVQPNRQLVEIHETFAYLSTWIYGFLLVVEIIAISKYNQFIKIQMINDILLFVENNFSKGLVSKLLAFLGIISISITGLLGGAMIYGVSADPLAPIILKLLGINI